ncbi:MAG: DedA family protein [Acidobacteria bacterium]|nr:DedA family protein [Acidobacteriota bacterium]
MAWRNPIRVTYDWVLSWADRPGGPWALAAISFGESSFFPIPPDILLIPLCLSAPRRAFWYAGLCTAASVFGGMFGYAIGLLFFESVGQRIVDLYNLTGLFETVGGLYAEYTAGAVIIAGFTPIPYKVFTILAGLVRVNFPVFVVASIIGRGGRFFLVAGLLRLFGDPMKDFIDRHFNWLTVALAVLFVAGFAVLNSLSH